MEHTGVLKHWVITGTYYLASYALESGVKSGANSFKLFTPLGGVK
jgi:hypothetical protein